MSTGAYLLLRFKERDKLLSVVETLKDFEQISRWDAVDGHYDLVLKLKESSPALTAHLQNMAGFAEMSSCELVADHEGNGSLAEDFSYSYIFIEAEKNKSDAIRETLDKFDAVAFCSPTTGNYDLVAVVKGEKFGDIDRTVDNSIRNLDGVLRLKRNRIISLDRM